MREGERPRILYDPTTIRAILDEAPIEKPARPAPRLNVDLSAAPPWRIKPMPVGRRRRPSRSGAGTATSTRSAEAKGTARRGEGPQS